MSNVSFPAIENLTYVNKPYEVTDGKAYLIEMFGTYCPPCRGQIPHIAKVAKDYEAKLNVIAVSTEELATVQNTVKRIPMIQKYNVAVDNSGVISELSSLPGVNGIPHAFIFNSEKVLIWHGHPASMDSVLGSL